MRVAADRVLGLALIGLAALAAFNASQFEVLFSYEPVGPKAFPILLAAILASLSLVLVFRPGENGEWPDKHVALRLLAVLAVLLVYAMLFTRMGFMMTTFVMVLLLARLFEAPWKKALIAGVCLSVGSYYLFTKGLGISLPTGLWLPKFN